MNLVGLLFLFQSNAVFAATDYPCDSFDLTRKSATNGTTYSVRLDNRIGQSYVKAIPTHSESRAERVYDLEITYEGNWYINTSSDVAIAFTLSSNKKAGVLEVVRYREVDGVRFADKWAFICTQVQTPHP